jgi:hypothetical protein
MAVAAPVPTTTPRALPAVTTVPLNSVLVLSCSRQEGGVCVVIFFPFSACFPWFVGLVGGEGSTQADGHASHRTATTLQATPAAHLNNRFGRKHRRRVLGDAAALSSQDGLQGRAAGRAGPKRGWAKTGKAAGLRHRQQPQPHPMPLQPCHPTQQA